MSATPANDVQTPPAWNYAPNIQHFFELSIKKQKKMQIVTSFGG